MLSTAEMIEHYRLTLLRLVAGLFVQAGIEPAGEGVKTLSRTVRASILLVLRQVESSARRLVFAETRGLDIPDYVPPPKRARVKRKSGNDMPRSGTARTPMFRLIDPRVQYAELYPHRKPRGSKPPRERRTERVLLFRLTSFDGQAPVEAWAEPDAEILPDDAMTAVAICRRLQAVHHALSDLPKQAQRMVREMAKRKAAPPGPGSEPPLKFGPAPGHRKRRIHEVDEILHDCQWLAREVETSTVGV